MPFLLTSQALSAGRRGGTARAQDVSMGTVTWQRTQTGASHGVAVAAAPSHVADLEQGRLVFCLFLVIQLLDGGLTYWGVSRFGIELEMNGLLATWMHEIGPAPTLFVAKT